MNPTRNLSTQLNQQLSSLQSEQFTGRLEAKSTTGKQWILYFGLGKIVWASDGAHPYRSWLRHLQQFCPQVQLPSKTFISEAQRLECWKYYILTVLLTQKTITPEQLKALVESRINEVLFDILQQEEIEKLDYTRQSEFGSFLVASGLKMSLVRVSVEQALRQSEQAWSDWSQKQLKHLSPNLAPSIKKPEQLQKEVSSKVYQNLVKLIDGKHTLREIAVKIKRDVLCLTRSLVPYIGKGYIELREIPDLSDRITFFNSSTTEKSHSSITAIEPLIACIDDSPQICQIMEEIVTKAGYRFIGIQDPLNAVSTLISCNPELIFLDIGMEIINGYEICTQLKRVSKLKNTPIIMLTGRDGIVDRVRAKMVGASDFLGKPIEIAQIIEILAKYLLEDCLETSLSQTRKA